jgi:hypothetical protein
MSIDASLNCFGALALEVSPRAADTDGPVQFDLGNETLERADAAPLIEPILIDLQRLLPGAAGLDLGLAMASFDPAELLRPGWPVFTTLADLLIGAPGERVQARVVSLSASEGRMPSTGLQPDRSLRGGPLRLLPFVLRGGAEHVAEVGRQMESELMEKGMAAAATALAAQTAFGLQLEHARYLSLHDLCAMTAMQYEHAGLAPVWRLLEAALFAPASTEWVEEAGEPPALYASGQVGIGIESPERLSHAAEAAGMPATSMHRLRQLRARQWQAVLAAHAISAECIALSSADVEGELRAALQRH